MHSEFITFTKRALSLCMPTRGGSDPYTTNTNTNKVTFVGVEESFLNISFPLFLLAFASIFVGFLVKEMVLSNTIYPMVPSFIKIAPFILSLLGMLLVFIVYSCGMGFR